MTISTETFVVVNTGSSANDGTGDSLRAAFVKVNQNFSNISDIGFDAGNINVNGSIECGQAIRVSGTATINGVLTANANVIVANVYVPATVADGGTKGQITFDGNYVYICVATNSWKRANLVAW
jgi:hypothetical protein